MTLTARQSRIVIGSLLGDGFLEKRSEKACFRFKQRAAHKKYVEWMFRELQSIRTDGGIRYRSDYDQYYFMTSLKKCDFSSLYWKFYRTSDNTSVKIVPEEIKDLLTHPISLAVWYMDDGSLDYRENYHYSYSLATHNFSLKGVQKLKKVLDENFEVSSSVYNNLIRGKRYPRIYIGVRGRNRFREIIQPYVSRFDCFSHKLPPK